MPEAWEFEHKRAALLARFHGAMASVAFATPHAHAMAQRGVKLGYPARQPPPTAPSRPRSAHTPPTRPSSARVRPEVISLLSPPPIGRDRGPGRAFGVQGTGAVAPLPPSRWRGTGPDRGLKSHA